MTGRGMSVLSIFAMLQLVAAGLAGCSTSVEGNPTPVGGEPGGGEDVNTPGGGEDPLAGNCAEGTCSVYDQCGCDPGQACDLDGAALDSGGTECREVSSPGQTQSNCDSPDQCAAGYSCLGDPGQCRKLCDEDGDCGTGRCIVQVVFENDAGDLEDVPDASACTKSCDPTSAEASGCPSDPAMGCRYYSYDPDGSGEEIHYTDCTPAGLGGDAADCSANDDGDCAPGYSCFVITFDDDTTADQCRQQCIYRIGNVLQEGQCAVGTCHNFEDSPARIDDVEYGVCF
jgi:hypothetical protein